MKNRRYNGHRFKVCGQCGKALGKGRRNRLYCSHRCQQRHFSGTVEKSGQAVLSYYARKGRQKHRGTYRKKRKRIYYVSPKYRAKMEVKSLGDKYIKQILVSELKVKRDEIPPEILDLKRQQLRLYRAIHRKGGGKCTQQKLAA